MCGSNNPCGKIIDTWTCTPGLTGLELGSMLEMILWEHTGARLTSFLILARDCMRAFWTAILILLTACGSWLILAGILTFFSLIMAYKNRSAEYLVLLGQDNKQGRDLEGQCLCTHLISQIVKQLPHSCGYSPGYRVGEPRHLILNHTEKYTINGSETTNDGVAAMIVSSLFSSE